MTLLSSGEDIIPKTLNIFMIEKPNKKKKKNRKICKQEKKTEKYASFKFNSLKIL
jgi:hypothetical protein